LARCVNGKNSDAARRAVSLAAALHNLATVRVAMRRNAGAAKSWASTSTPAVNVITELARLASLKEV
jgi:hypothetical protein